jgi:hypothetical protein
VSRKLTLRDAIIALLLGVGASILTFEALGPNVDGLWPMAASYVAVITYVMFRLNPLRWAFVISAEGALVVLAFIHFWLHREDTLAGASVVGALALMALTGWVRYRGSAGTTAQRRLR